MAKTSSRPAAKATERKGNGKTKTAVSLTDEAIKRLGAACTTHGVDQSEIVEWLINSNLHGYVIQVRQEPIPLGKSYRQANHSAPVMPDGSADFDAPVNLHAAAVA